MSAGNGRKLLVIDAVLAICVLSILYIKLNKRTVIIDIERGHPPVGLYEVLEGRNLSIGENPQAFFIFNSRPALSLLEDIDKLYHFYRKEGVDFWVVFSSPFRLSTDFHAPHHFFIRNRFSYTDSQNARVTLISSS